MLPENDALPAPDALSDRGPDGGEGARAPSSADELPHWNYDGSSTGQAPGHDSEVYLIPRKIFK